MKSFKEVSALKRSCIYAGKFTNDGMYYFMNLPLSKLFDTFEEITVVMKSLNKE